MSYIRLITADPATVPTPDAGRVALFADSTNGDAPSFKDDTGAVHSLNNSVSSVFGRTGAVVKVAGDYAVADVTGAAPLASPALTGTPTAPTAALGTNTTQVATTAFVQAATGTGAGLDGTINFIVDGGGSAIATGVKGDLVVDFACEIISVTVLLDQSGSIVIDIWKDTYANYPPVAGDSITASAKPTVTTATKSQDATLTGWATSIAAGDVLRFNVDSITTATRATLALKVRRT